MRLCQSGEVFCGAAICGGNRAKVGEVGDEGGLRAFGQGVGAVIASPGTDTVKVERGGVAGEKGLPFRGGLEDARMGVWWDGGDGLWVERAEEGWRDWGF